MITGYLLSERYQVGDVIGQGGMSVVLRSRDVRLDRDVAIKVLRTDVSGDPKYPARFRREARDAASLNHPAIVGVYDTGETESANGAVPYIVMEYVDGETLRDALNRVGRLPARRAMEIAADILAALDFSHRHGVVHRAVSPKNVMLDRSGAVKVMDFGIAQPLLAADATITSAVIESAHYLSPEQARGDPVDARSDVYSVGCVLYQMLTGQPPFTAASPVDVAQQHAKSAPRPPSASVPGLDAEIDSIVLTALEKSPLDRYQTAAQMRSALGRALGGERVRAAQSTAGSSAGRSGAPGPGPTTNGSPPLLAPPTSKIPDDDWEPDPASRPRRMWGFIGIGVLCLLVLIGAGWLTLNVINAGPPRAPVAVPDVSGKSLDEATAVLLDKRLTLGSVTPVDSDDASTGKVVAQRPSSLTQVDQNTAVNLEIGRGVTKVDVPNVVGSTSDAAKAALAGAHLVYAEELQPSSDADRGKVLTQSAAAGSQVAPNSTVSVTVGTGISLVTVPNAVIGRNVDDATRILQAANFEVVAEEGDGTEPVNQVIAMDVQSGRQVPEGTPVTITYSNNALMVMPGLQGKSADKAVGALQDLGWAGDSDSLTVSGQATSTPSLIGSVVTQDPAAGSVIKKIGTPVRVGVGVKQITMPNVVGKTRNQAAELLRQAGATNVTYSDAGTAPRGQSGRVKSQSPPANSAVGSDTAIVISVYSN